MSQPIVVIKSNRPGLFMGVAAALEARGFLVSVSIARGSRHDDFKITYRPGVPLARVAEVVGALDSTETDSIRPEEGQEPDIILHWPVHCGKKSEMREKEVEIVADTPEMGAKLGDFFRSMGFTSVVQINGPTLANKLDLTMETPSGMGCLIRLKMRELGCAPTCVETSHPGVRPGRGKIKVEVRDPALVKLPAVERFPVKVCSDSLDDGLELVRILAGHGFTVDIGEPVEAARARNASLSIRPGPMGGGAGASSRAVLFHVVEQYLNARGVDMIRYPLAMKDVADDPSANNKNSPPEGVVVLPIAACLAGTARSRGGAFPDRFDVHVRTDCPEHSMVNDLKARLEAAGFTNLIIESTSDPRVRRNPLIMAMGSAFTQDAVVQTIREIVAQSANPMVAAGINPRPQCVFPPDDDDIFINLPLLGWEDGSLMAEMSNASGYDIKIHCEDPDEWEDVIDELRAMGFDDFEIETGTVRIPEMKFGGAPPRLLDRVARVVADCASLSLARVKAWPDPDDDIYLFLPRRPGRPVPDEIPGDEEETGFQGDPGQEVGEYCWQAPVEAEGPFVQKEGARLLIGGLVLPRRPGPPHPLAPCPGRFSHFCLDMETAATLRHVAVSVLMGEPCLLEGETSTSKTSTIEYLASLLGQPVVRINLNGQTDTGELLGRFVPNEQGGGGEGSPRAGWRWQDGLVVQAIRHGWWLLLDEVNLAETQILERLNPLLEAHPSLVLTEHGNEIFGGNGTPIHPSFRIFGTMNPAEYAGRSVMSPAYKDRWRGLRQVPVPGESDFRSMLRLMVLGQQPSIVLDGVAYPGSQGNPSHPGLDSLLGIEEELDALARFHASALNAASEGSGKLATRRKERPVFTRRGLLSVLDHVCRVARPEAGSPVGPALRKAAERYYLARLADNADARVLKSLLDASGLGIGVPA